MCEKAITEFCKNLFAYDKMEESESLETYSTMENIGKITIVNEDDHPILFELCSDNNYSKKKWVQPNDEMSVDFDVSASFIWKCKAWFNGLEAEPIIFNVWEGTNVKFMIRKDDGIYKANLDGTNEKIYVQFCLK